jgi:hypothetical protein
LIVRADRITKLLLEAVQAGLQESEDDTLKRLIDRPFKGVGIAGEPVQIANDSLELFALERFNCHWDKPAGFDPLLFHKSFNGCQDLGWKN